MSDSLIDKTFDAFASADATVRDQFVGMVENLSMSRERFFRKFFYDRRTDVDAEVGYPETMEVRQYRKLFLHEPIANRVVTIFPKETWKSHPRIVEDGDGDPENKTEFEKQVANLDVELRGESWFESEEGAGSPVNEALQRVDELSGIGSYGILLLGFDDGAEELSTPVPGIDPDTGKSRINPRQTTDNALRRTRSAPPSGGKLKLVYLRAFDESEATIKEFEDNKLSPRYGLPKMYEVILNDPILRTSSTAGLDIGKYEVHWTRVIHVADNRLSSDVFGIPRLQPVLHRILDLKKLYGGSAEMYWRGAFPGYSLETNPGLSPRDVDIDKRGLKQKMEALMTGLQRYIWSTGMTVKSLAPQVVDPSPQIQRQLEAICVQISVPMRKFLGSERGELASSDDEDDWHKKLTGRRMMKTIPHIVVPFYDRLISVGVLPAPKSYKVQWPDTGILTPKERVGLAEARTRTMALFVSQGVELLIERRDFLIKELGYTTDEVDAMIKRAEEREEEVKKEEEAAMMKQAKMMGGPAFSRGMPQPGKQTRQSARPGQGPADPRQQKAATKARKGPTARQRPVTNRTKKGRK